MKFSVITFSMQYIFHKHTCSHNNVLLLGVTSGLSFTDKGMKKASKLDGFSCPFMAVVKLHICRENRRSICSQ